MELQKVPQNEHDTQANQISDERKFITIMQKHPKNL